MSASDVLGHGRTALVTGASRGIGPLIARQLAGHGGHVVLTARSVAGLEAVTSGLSASGADVSFIPADLAQPGAAERLVRAVEQRHGGIDLLVNNAGGDPLREFHSMTIEENVAYPLLNQKSIQCPPDQVLPRVEQALEFVSLRGTLEKFPAELSGGMRRRAAIARAVITEPPLQMYDSPTAGLDPITAHTIMELLIKERDVSRATTLMVTHRYQDGNLMANFRYNSENGALEPARGRVRREVRTRFIVMKQGRLIFDGDQDRLEASSDPYITKFFKQRE